MKLIRVAASMCAAMSGGIGLAAQPSSHELGPIFEVTAVEPSRAARVHRTVSGTCNGQNVQVDVVDADSKLGASGSVTVTVSGAAHSFESSSDFVVDLTSDSSKVYRLGILCEAPANQFILIAFGTSFTFDSSSGKYSTTNPLWTAKATFGQNANLISYSGIRPANPAD